MSQPERVRERSKRATEQNIMFPTIPNPHGFQMIFLDYDYNKFVSSLSEGALLTDSNAADVNAVKKLGFVPAANVAPEVKDFVSIELPFPMTLNDQNQIANESFERSFLYERLASALAGAGGPGAAMASAGKMATQILAGIRSLGRGSTDDGGPSTAQGVIENVLGDNGVQNAAMFTQYLSRTFLPGDLARQASGVAGAVANPLQTLSFNGVALKSYSFTWELYPSSPQDSKQIRKIVQTLKRKALPEIANGLGTEGSGGAQGLNRAFLKYPSVVRINLLGVDESYFVRFKPAMISNVDVNYGGGSAPAILKGGRPAAVQLSITFNELNIHTAEDYEESDEDSSSQNKTPETGSSAGRGVGSF